MIAFTTTTGEVAIPIAIERLAEMGVPRFISSFVIPTGYTFNMDGSTLYIAAGSMFIAQAYGIDLSLSQQIMIVLTLMLATKGSRASPEARSLFWPEPFQLLVYPWKAWRLFLVSTESWTWPVAAVT